MEKSWCECDSSYLKLLSRTYMLQCRRFHMTGKFVSLGARPARGMNMV